MHKIENHSSWRLVYGVFLHEQMRMQLVYVFFFHSYKKSHNIFNIFSFFYQIMNCLLVILSQFHRVLFCCAAPRRRHFKHVWEKSTLYDRRRKKKSCKWSWMYISLSFNGPFETISFTLSLWRHLPCTPMMSYTILHCLSLGP